MKIGIIYVGIGRYVRLWDGFYKSCELHFIPDAQKDYFVFTDGTLPQAPNVNTLAWPDEGWPAVALNRYKMINSIRRRLELYDYIFFFNGNTLFVEDVTADEFLPDRKGHTLTTLVWDSNERRPLDECPFERRPESSACVPIGQGEHYYQSGILGGITKDYLELQQICETLTNQDLAKGISAVWQDESYLNRYLLGRPTRIVGTRYGRPENRKEPVDAKIIFRDKNKIFGRNYLKSLKGKHTSPVSRLFHSILHLFSKG